MDGNDAVEFFKDFGAEFRVDLDDLYTRWDEHFGPEGGPSFGFLVIVVLCIAAGFWLRDLLGLIPAWASTESGRLASRRARRGDWR